MPDFYAIGIEDVGLWTPQNVLDQMNVVNDAVNSLDLVISGSDKAREAFKNSWTAFRDTWRKFYDAHTGGPLAWMSRAMNETHDQVEDYATRTKAWQNAIAKEGLILPGPGPLVDREDKTRTYILYGIGGIGAIVVVYGLGKYALGRLFGD